MARKMKTMTTTKTPEAIQAEIDDVDARLTQADAEYRRLSDGRARVVLDGGDMDEFHHKLFIASETRRTLAAAGEALEKQLDEAEKARNAAMIEGRVAEIRANDLAAMKGCLVRLHRALADVNAAGEELAAIDQAIGETRHIADFNSRPDLAIRDNEINEQRAEARKEIGAEDHGAQPIERFDGESDTAFELRQQNAAAVAARRYVLTNPLKVEGEKAMSVIENVIEPDINVRLRNSARVQTISYKHPNGDAIRKIVPVGEGGKVRLGPFGPDMGEHVN